MTCHSVFPDRQAMRNLWNRKPSVKKRAGELPYKSISPAFSAVFNRTKRDFFAAKSFLLAARTKTSCRKTEKTTAEKRKNPSRGHPFSSIRTARACIIRLTDCKHIPLRRRHARQHHAHDLPRFRPKRKRNPRFRRHPASRRPAKYARISGPPVLGGGIRDSRPLRPDVLTACSKEARGRC